MKTDTVQCVFCSPQVDASAFAESEHFRAIYNLAPILPGHSLIVPKRHKTSVLDLDADEICEFGRFAQSVTRFLKIIFKSNGFNWTIQNGEAAGQTISHMHLHLIPRSEGDLPHPGDWYPLLKQSTSAHIDDETRSRLTTDQLQQVVTRLKTKWDMFDSADSPTNHSS